MTHREYMMLVVCFSAAVGTFTANVFIAIKYAIDLCIEKRRRRK